MRALGMHIRLDNGLQTVIEHVQALQLTTFQCFLLHQVTQQFVQPTAEEVRLFKQATEHINKRFVHASYWTNLAQLRPTSVRFVQGEIELAKRLGFTHIIFHPGYAKGALDKLEGIQALARRLNFMLRREHDITIVLENSAHDGLSIGGNIADFRAILELLEHPEKVRFCFDTVHAHVYGYDMQSLGGQQEIINVLDSVLGIEHVELIHLNNTRQERGSYRDEHRALTGGVITLDALDHFVHMPQLSHVPLVMEMPADTLTVQHEQLEIVRSWMKVN